MNDSTKQYEYGRAYHYLKKSGLAKTLFNTSPRKGFVEIDYKSLMSSDRKHANVGRSGESYYFNFVVDFISAIIGLATDDSINDSVKLTDKSLIIKEKALYDFRTGWKIVEKMYSKRD